jgi:hypothetical protein
MAVLSAVTRAWSATPGDRHHGASDHQDDRQRAGAEGALEVQRIEQGSRHQDAGHRIVFEDRDQQHPGDQQDADDAGHDHALEERDRGSGLAQQQDGHQAGHERQRQRQPIGDQHRQPMPIASRSTALSAGCIAGDQ